MLAASGLRAESAVPVFPAQLLHAWWIDGSEGLDLSGLSFCNGELLAVADKSSERIYRLSPEPGKDTVPLATKAEFTRPPLPHDQPVSIKARALHYASTPLSMDFEGITCDASDIFLLSERHNRIVKLDQAGRRGQWMPARWSESAREQGFLQLFNAESEGVVKVGEDFWVALERDPRGLLKLQPGDGVGQHYYRVPPVPGLDFRDRPEDLTALAFYDGSLFTLERNAFAVCRRAIATLAAEWCVQYRGIEEAPEYIYRKTHFGKGEGLAVNDQGIFVVLDNNSVTRVVAPEDSRGLLMQLAFPAYKAE
ncbi:esterase-like activity of phytase family protein [Microbulbifer hydrolyticus]|uniref:Phytase-like domain-containing protein n=1 Tax=Microbulbifer hydrolyticus TaxID=48074 RepID=A0A6P1T9N3_9GAMM|nr:esterase-like activity of phytase family protein [Microbulbifer hydrolyticus]MBB5209977.1 hypothetical protein [Microbulbifer hydrolyticus]QHQ39494.1 hypothetical protein GTQ55_11210 [Microbulbifer hydrolyticus]